MEYVWRCELKDQTGFVSHILEVTTLHSALDRIKEITTTDGNVYSITLRYVRQS